MHEEGDVLHWLAHTRQQPDVSVACGGTTLLDTSLTLSCQQPAYRGNVEYKCTRREKHGPMDHIFGEII